MAVIPDEHLAREVDSSFSEDSMFSDRSTGRTVGAYLRWGLAIASFGAAALHFAFSPGHFDQYWAYGTFFVVAAWLQLAWGLAMLTRPTRAVLVVGLLNVLAIGVWLISRTAGLPFGPNEGIAEAVGFPDVLAVAFEAVVVVGCGVLLWRPSIARRPIRAASFWPGVAAALTVGVVVAASASLTPRFAGEHHGAGVASGAAGVTGAAAAGHAHGAAGATGASTAGLTGNSPCEKSGPPASEGQTQGEGHNQRGPTPQKPVTQAERVLLEQQQAQARTVVARYPTLADAQKGGYALSTGYVPCIGTHVTNARYAIRFDPSNPSELLYDGTQPDSKIVGLSYLVFSPQGPPEGFAGPNDFWHTHSSNGGLCIKGIVIGAETMSKQQCESLGGRKVGLKGVYMMHDWVVPGWECSWGVFAGECPELGGKLNKNAFS